VRTFPGFARGESQRREWLAAPALPGWRRNHRFIFLGEPNFSNLQSCVTGFRILRTSSLSCPGTDSPLTLFKMSRPRRGHRETYGFPAPTTGAGVMMTWELFSTLSRRSRRMKRQFRSPFLGASPHPPACYVLLAPRQALRFPSPLKVLLLPPANYDQTNPPACPLASSTTSTDTFLITPTPLNLHKCLPLRRLPSNGGIGRTRTT
jgi:hypothetical protein